MYFTHLFLNDKTHKHIQQVNAIKHHLDFPSGVRPFGSFAKMGPHFTGETDIFSPHSKNPDSKHLTFFFGGGVLIL